MKILEIILRLLDGIISAIAYKKAQSQHDKLEENPADWFNGHFGGVSTSNDKANKTNTKNKPTE